MSKHILLCENVPLVEAAHVGGRQRPSSILINASWTTGLKGAANAIAQTWHNPRNRIESCHYVVDDGQTLRCLPDNVVSLPRVGIFKGAVSVNICYDPPEQPSRATLINSAELVASLCKRYGFPVRAIEASSRDRWTQRIFRRNRGIVFATPEGFPRGEFLNLVGQAYDSLK